MAIRPAAEPSIRLLTIFMITSKLLCREGSGSAGCKHPKVGSLNPLKPALSLRAFGHTRMNARDLSEPPNGTTSGCPPPSQHHNYRGLLHTQQRNSFSGLSTVRFWVGVAQITRGCDRAFSARHYFISPFLDSSVCPPNCYPSGCNIGSSLPERRFAPNRAAKTGLATPIIGRENGQLSPSLAGETALCDLIAAELNRDSR